MPGLVQCGMFMIIKLEESNQNLKKCVCNKLVPQGAILQYIYEKTGKDTLSERESYTCQFCNKEIVIILV